ncbi:S41 family peptidase [Pseudoalteromonas fenneropenaei]|uniref:Tricorn protease homolog n=1 Tax=Pseudoalteromonas fenneropenaei TaxID=1737459 RepID=A0ABV7CPX5_9GAMM
MANLSRTAFAVIMAAGAFGSVALSAAEQIDSNWWRQTALSPDGKTIAFAHQGDIYVVAAKGGKAQPLTTHAAYDGYPVWSADGKQLAFASDRYGNFDIFVVPASGGVAKRLTYHSANDIPSDFTGDGKAVLFTSLRTDDAKSAQFPYGVLSETYQVALSGGTPVQVDTLAMEKARFNRKGDKLLYQDAKGYEDPMRKKHTSSITRDIWLWDAKTKTRQQLTEFNGEDRDPVWSDKDQGFYYLSEQHGTYNVYQYDFDSKKSVQLTSHDTHPVRDLSADKQGNLVYSYHGNVYRLDKGSRKPVLVNIEIAIDSNRNAMERQVKNNGASEFALSPNGKEVAFVVRGDVYVTAIEYGTTVRLTNTPEQERNVSFSPDGRSVLYAGERDNSWNLYTTSLVNESDKYFFAATQFAEQALLADQDETFQPAYSPDGKEVAYLANRAAIKVLNLESGKTRTVLDKKYNYSYADGDQYFAWSPDGKWLATHYLAQQRWMTDVGIVAADGNSEPINISQSGYGDSEPMWAMDGNALLWFSDKYGRRAHGSWGSESNVLATFLNQRSFDKFKLSKEDYALEQELAEADKKAKDDAIKDDESKDSKDAAVDKTSTTAIEIDLRYLQERNVRLTQHSADLSGAYLTKDGRTFYYLAQFEQGFDLWKRDFNEGTTALVAKLGADGASMKVDKDEKFAYVLTGGKLSKVELSSGKPTAINFAAEVIVNEAAEREHLFEHIWRQTKEKFYVKDMHGVDWDVMKAAYQAKLAGIAHPRDFATLLSELLGELNASHTGASYRPTPSGSNTASLGAFFDSSYQGNGLKISEVMAKGPLDKANSKVKAGMVITAIDGVALTPQVNAYALLDHKAGQRLRLSVSDGEKTFDQVIRPITSRDEYHLRYDRWVEQRRALVETLSGGRIGYVHVQAMNTRSFQTVYNDMLGRYADKEAMIVDTRFNGGGWLHEDLNTLLSGKKYFDFVPRGQQLGAEPLGKWYRPSAVIVSEGNYSDAYLFPYSYKQLGLGKLVGMPVAATGTAVWWETQFTGDLVFGIPQVGMRDNDGNLQENRDLIPDVVVNNDPNSLVRGEDKQLAKTVEVLLADLK